MRPPGRIDQMIFFFGSDGGRGPPQAGSLRSRIFFFGSDGGRGPPQALKVEPDPNLYILLGNPLLGNPLSVPD